MSEISSTPDYSPPSDLDRWGRYALIAAVIGIAASALGAFTNLEQFSQSYLVSWVYWMNIAMGSFGILMLHHLTRGGWGLMIRRILEASSRTLPVIVVLFLPIALRLSDIFVWAKPGAADDPLIAVKDWYLTEPFFLVRAAGFFAIWGAFVLALNRLSLKQDQTGDLRLFRRMQSYAGPGIVIYALTASLASIDWMMSLDPHWYSSLFPIYFMGGQIVAAMAFTIVIVRYLSSREPMKSVFSAQHYHDYGNLQMAFVLLWSYFALSQFLIIWSGNLAEETVWYLERQHGPWKWVSLSLAMFHFSVPFFFLLSRRIKRNIDLLVRIACLLLIMRWVDLYWLAAPALSHGHFSPHWLDFATLLAVGGVWAAVFIQQLKKRPLLPIHDPYLEEALDA
jgi:hypothetical protein